MPGLNIFFVSLRYNSNREANLFLNIYFKIEHHVFKNDAKIITCYLFRILLKIICILSDAEQ